MLYYYYFKQIYFVNLSHTVPYRKKKKLSLHLLKYCEMFGGNVLLCLLNISILCHFTLKLHYVSEKSKILLILLVVFCNLS